MQLRFPLPAFSPGFLSPAGSAVCSTPRFPTLWCCNRSRALQGGIMLWRDHRWLEMQRLLPQNNRTWCKANLLSCSTARAASPLQSHTGFPSCGSETPRRPGKGARQQETGWEPALGFVTSSLIAGSSSVPPGQGGIYDRCVYALSHRWVVIAEASLSWRS